MAATSETSPNRPSGYRCSSLSRKSDENCSANSVLIIAGAMAAPGPKLDERIEQLTGIGVSHAIVPTFPPDQLAEIGQTLHATYG